MQTPKQPDPPPSFVENELAAWEHQRAQVAAHLAWLDARIAQMQSGKDDLKATKAPSPLAVPTDEQGLPASLPLLPEAEPLLVDTPSEISATDYTLRSARLGCTVLAVLAIGGTVFFFFVLPYWIYR